MQRVLLNVTGVNQHQRLSLLDVWCAFSQLLDVLWREPGQGLGLAVDCNAQGFGLERVVQSLACTRRGLDVGRFFVSRFRPCAEEAWAGTHYQRFPVSGIVMWDS